MSSKVKTTQQQQQQDHDCARFAREALFPSRLHRDVTHANNNFPALVVLDRYRQQLVRGSSLDQQQQMMTFSNVFPRRVVVVRNLANENDIQWNGQPDIEQQHQQQHGASFEVVPNRLTVRCTSECDKLLQNKLQRAFIQNSNNGNGHEIVVCSDRVLQSDYKKYPLDSSSATSAATVLPPRSLAAAEEVLAHALVIVEQQELQQQQADKNNNNNNNKDTIALSAAASIQVQAAQAAECYYSCHEFEKHQRMQVKRGSQLGMIGFSLLPHGIQQWMQRQCIQRVATEHLLMEQQNNNNKNDKTTSRSEAQKAVQEAMKQQGGAC